MAIGLPLSLGSMALSRIYDLSPSVARRGRPKDGRLEELADLFRLKESRQAYERWRDDPITQAYISAFRRLSYFEHNGGVIPTGGDAQAQLGMTMAFQTAERLMSDPSSLINVFDDGAEEEAEQVSLPRSTYDNAPDDLDDSI